MPDPGPDTFARATADADRGDRNAYGRIPSDPPAGQPRRDIWPWLMAGILASFLIGLLGSPWLEAEVRRHLPQSSAEESQTERVEALEVRLKNLESLPPPPVGSALPQDAAVSARIAALETATAAHESARGNLSAELQALTDNIARVSDQATTGDETVRDMFLLAVMRRMVETGRPLTPLDPYVAARFRARDGAAVDALLAWSREPQTRRTLAARLPELGRTGAQADSQAAGSFWERVKAGLAGLITVRQPDVAETPGRADVVREASAALRNGELELAISEMAAGPQDSATREWVRDGQLLLAAEVALDRLDSRTLAQAITLAERDSASTSAQRAVNAD